MKKIIFFAVIAFCAVVIFAQSENKETNNRLRLGFGLGVNYSFLQSKYPLPTNAEYFDGVGMKIGVLCDYSITERVSYSAKTEVAFNECGVKMINLANEFSEYRVFPVSIEVGNYILYRFGSKKLHPYLIAGPTFRYPLHTQPLTSTDFSNKFDVAFDFGIGLSNTLNDFVFAPEIKFSLGLFNVNKHPAFQTLKYNSVSLVLHFMSKK
jgi:hypothetical protein